MSQSDSNGAERTSIQISTATWQALNQRKQGPSDTFDDVIQRLLEDE